MNLLVDSHVLIWWLDDDPRLAAVTRSLIESADNVFVSVMSIWELGIKSAAGKIEIGVDLADEAKFRVSTSLTAP
jgi:PIN domain nuclease of toxin-antitoxin system